MTIRAHDVVVIGREVAVPLVPFDVTRRTLVDLSRPGLFGHPLDRAQLPCYPGAGTKYGHECLTCHHFGTWRPGPGDAQATIYCLFSSRDKVTSLTTWLPKLVTVPPDLPLAKADERAAAANVHHLPVIDGDELVGLICRCDLARAGGVPGRVADRMSAALVAIDAQASLGEALGAIHQYRIGCLPVVAGEILVGVLTRGDLRRAGVAEELLGARHCAACGGAHDVLSVERCGGVDFCGNCLAHATVDENDELGGGD